MRRREFKNKYLIITLIALTFITVGFALLQNNLRINGTVATKSNSWNIYFDNVILNPSSVSKSLPTISERTSLSFNVELTAPGDLYEFTVDIVNAGTIDAMVKTITATNLTSEQAKLVDLSYTYSNGTPIKERDSLKAQTTKTIKVLVKYKGDINNEDLPNSNISLPISIEIEYVQEEPELTNKDDNLNDKDDETEKISFPNVLFKGSNDNSISNNFKTVGFNDELLEKTELEFIEFEGNITLSELWETALNEELVEDLTGNKSQPGLIYIDFTCYNKDIPQTGPIPGTYCLNYELNVVYSANDETRETNWNTSTPTFTQSGGDFESIMFFIPDEIDFTYRARSTKFPNATVEQLGQVGTITAKQISMDNLKYLLNKYGWQTNLPISN